MGLRLRLPKASRGPAPCSGVEFTALRNKLGQVSFVLLLLLFSIAFSLYLATHTYQVLFSCPLYIWVLCQILFHGETLGMLSPTLTSHLRPCVRFLSKLSCVPRLMSSRAWWTAAHGFLHRPDSGTHRRVSGRERICSSRYSNKTLRLHVG